MPNALFARSKPASDTRAQVRLVIRLTILATAGALGCRGEVDDEDFEVGAAADRTSASEPIDASNNNTPCTPDRFAKLQSAVDYASNRVDDGLYAFAECLNRSYLWGTHGQHGWQIGPMVAASPITQIRCAGAAESGNPISVSGERLSADDIFIDDHSIVAIAAAIVREILHDRGFGPSSGMNLVDAHDSNRASEQGEACIRLWKGIPAVDKGFVLWWDGTKVGHEPNYSRASAVTSCAWNRKNYPKKKVECYLNNARLGYELYRDGSDLALRVGFEPGYTRAEAAFNCFYNVKNHPKLWHECLFDGARIGFELFRDKVREVQEPTWTKDKAVAECARETKAHPNEKIECYFDGRGIGYELFWDGRRVGFEPTWTESQAMIHCAWNKKNHATKVVDCQLDGQAIGNQAEPSLQQGSADASGTLKRDRQIPTK